jgi:hypothetical protein
VSWQDRPSVVGSESDASRHGGGHTPETEAEQQKVIDAWNSWFAKHGEAEVLAAKVPAGR